MAQKSIFKRWSGSAWVEYYFKTSADLIDETASYKVMTSAERDAIGTYLTNGFNTASKLVQINAANAAQDPSKIDRSLIGDLSGTYLTVNSPTFTGEMTGSTLKNVNNSLILRSQFSTLNYAGIVLSGDSNPSGTLVPGYIEFLAPGGLTSTAFKYKVDPLDVERGLIDLQGTNRITGLVSPVVGTDATTKAYVDALVASGLRWAPGGPVEVASTANIPSLSGLLTIDGVTLTAGQRVLVYKQDTTSQNGIYIAAVGAWEKVLADSAQGIMVFVMHGATHNDWTFQNTNGTTWIETSKVDTITASTGLTKVGTDIRVATGGITNAMLAGSITWDKITNYGFQDNITAYTSLNSPSGTNTYSGISWDTSLASAIKLLRGTANYNTDNTETIAGAYDLAEVKNRTYTYTTATPETGSGQHFEGTTFVTGDLYFYDITPAP